jgi:CRISPR-associated protein Csx17
MNPSAVDLPLPGCAPVPLAHYLKALGILRLVSEQCDASAKGFWKNDVFHLVSALDRDALTKFFLNQYLPTPIIAPWNGGSGFHPSDNKDAIDSIARSASSRFQEYREVIRTGRACLDQLALRRKPERDEKQRLLQLCRNRLRGKSLKAFDTAVLLTDDGAKFPPLIGTGWNDGRLEFTKNFMQRVIEVLDPVSGSAAASAEAWLSQSLFASNIQTQPTEAPVGQFLPGAAGGANATSGFDAKSSVNPWDFILLIEGTVLFSAAAVRKLESAEPGQLVYPFCVRQAGVGYATAAIADENQARAEMWMPLWSNPATFAELSAIFGEGRAQIGGRPARNGVDFTRAVVTLGVDRGIGAFQRYGFQVRNGLAYFATPLERVPVERNTRADLLSDVDGWFDRFRAKASRDGNAAASVTRALRSLEEAILDLCKNDRAQNMQALLIALGACERALARSMRWAKENVQPVFGLTSRWLHEADTGTTEFRLAAALASTSGIFGSHFLPLRAHLEPVEIKGGVTKRWPSWLENESNDVVWREGTFITTLNAMFSRRLVLAQQNEKQITDRSVCPVHFPDLTTFIEGEVDDDLFSDLLWGLVLINWQTVKQEDLPQMPLEPEIGPSAFYALLKLCFSLSTHAPVPLVPAIHHQAANGNGITASQIAARRLRASGFAPAVERISVAGTLSRRTAASLLFPIRGRQAAILRNTVPRPKLESEP